MLKKYCQIFLFHAFLVFTANFAFAGNCPDMVGEWEIVNSGICYEREDDSFEYGQMPENTLHITNQEDCLFYGYVEIEGDPIDIDPVTGVLHGRLGRQITVVMDGIHVMNGKLDRFNGATMKYSRFTGTSFSVSVGLNDEQCAGFGAVMRK